ncbi:MAG: hypothetical protein R6W31_19720 [Bacteroidales bacterium]
MKTNITGNKATMIIVTALALIISGLFLFKNYSLRNQFQKEEIRSEALLSEKLVLEKSLEKFKKDLKLFQGKNANLDLALKESSDRFAMKENEIKRLIKDNASLSDLKKKNTELEALGIRLKEEITVLDLKMNQLIADNKRVGDQLEVMKSNNETLAFHNAMLEAMLSDNYQMEALKGKREKLTVVARRTNTLVASFDVPSGFGEEIYFKVYTPDEKEFSSIDNESASIRLYNQDKNLMASLSEGTPAHMNHYPKRVELIYKPEYKLIKGIYSFNVYDGKDYMGSVQLRLK